MTPDDKKAPPQRSASVAWAKAAQALVEGVCLLGLVAVIAQCTAGNIW